LGGLVTSVKKVNKEKLKFLIKIGFSAHLASYPLDTIKVKLKRIYCEKNLVINI
jgi:hypothetical protein